MPKKTKLEDLKIQSFVTSLTEGKKSKVKGGYGDESCPTCVEVCLTFQCTLEDICSGGSNIPGCPSAFC
jgi:hypothetical protein